MATYVFWMFQLLLLRWSLQQFHGGGPRWGIFRWLCVRSISLYVGNYTGNCVHEVGEFAKYELSGHKAVERFCLEEVSLTASAFVEGKEKKILDLLFLAVGQNEGLSNLIRSVYCLQDVGHRFRLIDLAQTAPVFVSKKIEEHPAIRLLSALSSEYDILLKFEIVLEHEVVDDHFTPGRWLASLLFNEALADLEQFLRLLLNVDWSYLELPFEGRHLLQG